MTTVRRQDQALLLVLDQSVAVCKEIEGSKFCVKYLPFSSAEVIVRFFLSMRDSLDALAYNTHATFVLQKLVEVCGSSVSVFPMQSVAAQLGITALRQIPLQFVDRLRGQLVGLACHISGSHVVQKLLRGVNREYQIKIINEFCPQMALMCADPFGTYCVQCALEVVLHNDAQPLYRAILAADIVRMSKFRNSDLVVESLLTSCDEPCFEVINYIFSTHVKELEAGGAHCIRVLNVFYETLESIKNGKKMLRNITQDYVDAYIRDQAALNSTHPKSPTTNSNKSSALFYSSYQGQSSAVPSSPPSASASSFVSTFASPTINTNTVYSSPSITATSVSSPALSHGGGEGGVPAGNKPLLPLASPSQVSPTVLRYVPSASATKNEIFSSFSRERGNSSNFYSSNGSNSSSNVASGEIIANEKSNLNAASVQQTQMQGQGQEQRMKEGLLPNKGQRYHSNNSNEDGKEDTQKERSAKMLTETNKCCRCQKTCDDEDLFTCDKGHIGCGKCLRYVVKQAMQMPVRRVQCVLGGNVCRGMYFDDELRRKLPFWKGK